MLADFKKNQLLQSIFFNKAKCEESTVMQVTILYLIFIFIFLNPLITLKYFIDFKSWYIRFY